MGDGAARIGPNAVLQLIAALRRRGLSHRLEPLFAEAGLAPLLTAPPESMIEEASVARLHAAARRMFGEAEACDLAHEAGRLTGDYLLANRIPRFAPPLLRRLPGSFAAGLLLRAMARHAWTFAGGGRFAARLSPRLTIEIVNPLLCAGDAGPGMRAFYAGAFGRIFGGCLGRPPDFAEVPAPPGTCRLAARR
jgi:divinyl protochlorophyllide a 8-vinyl-reductase